MFYDRRYNILFNIGGTMKNILNLFKDVIYIWLFGIAIGVTGILFIQRIMEKM